MSNPNVVSVNKLTNSQSINNGVTMKNTNIQKQILNNLKDKKEVFTDNGQYNGIEFYVNGEKSNNEVYLPYFIADLGIKIDKIEYWKYNTDDETARIIAETNSKLGFSYLRDDGLINILIHVNGNILDAKEFLNAVGININKSKSIHKAGKRLGSILSVKRFARYYNHGQISWYINDNPKYDKIMDGTMGMMRLSLALTLDPKCKAGNLYQGRMVNDKFYTKGNIKVVPDYSIDKDVVLYQCNIMDDITLKEKKTFITIEPLKTGSARMDIQSLFNFWESHSTNEWKTVVEAGMLKTFSELKDGTFLEKLDTFKNAENDEYRINKWILQYAAMAGIDYRDYTGLYKKAVNNALKGMNDYAVNSEGKATFNFPLLDAIRSYIMPDMLNYDQHGNIKPTLKSGKVHISNKGMVYFSLEDITEIYNILGGADGDDNLVVRFYKDKNGNLRVFIYRSPNGQGEFVDMEVEYSGIDVHAESTIRVNKLGGLLRPEPAKETKPRSTNASKLNDFFNNKSVKMDSIKVDESYSRERILDALHKGTFNEIGGVSIGEFARSSVRIYAGKGKKYPELQNYKWLLENVIDKNTMGKKSGEMDKVIAMYNYMLKNNIPVAKSILNRLPKGFMQNGKYVEFRPNVKTTSSHPVDILVSYVSSLEKRFRKHFMNKEDGVVTQCKNSVNMPISNSESDVRLADKLYNEWFNGVKECEKENVFLTAWTEFMNSFIIKFNKLPYNTRKSIVQTWISWTYNNPIGAKTNDTLIWLGDFKDKDGNQHEGIAGLTLEVLADHGFAKHVEYGGEKAADLLSDSIFGLDISDMEYNGKGLRRGFSSK